MYLNTLICLEENVAGYGKSNKNPSGHVTIMSPGIIKCYVQNLRDIPGEYTVYLISKSQNKAIRLGNLNTEDGNKQTTWKVDLDNLEGTGVKGKDIDCVAIVVEGESIGKTDTVLIGYTKDKYLITTMLESALPKRPTKPTSPAIPITKPVIKPTIKPTEPEENCECEPCGCGCEEQPGMNKPAKPGEGPGPVIIPTPDSNKPGMNKPAKLGEGPGPVIIPTPDSNKPGMNKPAKPGEGPGPVIIPTPDSNKPGMNKPAKPGEGPGPVIIPTPDKNQPAKPGEGPGPVIMPMPGENEPEEPEDGIGPVIMPTPDEDDLGEGYDQRYQDEIKVLTRLQNLFSESSDKEMLARRVQSIIEDSVKPLSQSTSFNQNRANAVPHKNREDEEQQYLNEIENVLKSIQNNMNAAKDEKKSPFNEKETVENEKVEDKEDEEQDIKGDLLRVRDIFTDSSEIEPFEEKDEEIDWVRISMAELISMPQFSYEWCTNPFVTYCYHKFGFLILGRDKNIEQYYIGIPDIYDTKRKFILSIDKIESFRGRSNKALQPGDYGYWIVRV